MIYINKDWIAYTLRYKLFKRFNASQLHIVFTKIYMHILYSLRGTHLYNYAFEYVNIYLCCFFFFCYAHIARRLTLRFLRRL